MEQSNQPAHRPAPKLSRTQELDPNQETDFQGNRPDTNANRQEASVVTPQVKKNEEGTSVVPPPSNDSPRVDPEDHAPPTPAVQNAPLAPIEPAPAETTDAERAKEMRNDADGSES